MGLMCIGGKKRYEQKGAVGARSWWLIRGAENYETFFLLVLPSSLRAVSASTRSAESQRLKNFIDSSDISICTIAGRTKSSCTIQLRHTAPGSSRTEEGLLCSCHHFTPISAVLCLARWRTYPKSVGSSDVVWLGGRAAVRGLVRTHISNLAYLSTLSFHFFVYLFWTSFFHFRVPTWLYTG